MKLLSISLLLAATLLAADKPTPKDAPAPTVAELQATIKAKDARIAWLEQKLALTEARAKAMAEYFTSDGALVRLEAAKPVESKEPAK